jgi:hypothetical protein
MIKPISPTGSGRPRLRTKAAAAYLGIGESTLEKTRANGNGPRYSKLNKRTVVYDPDELDRYTAANTQISTAENLVRRKPRTPTAAAE